MISNKPCKFFFQNGNCIKGNACNFSHTYNPNNDSIPNNPRNPNSGLNPGTVEARPVKDGICDYFKKGVCKNTAETCNFMHGYCKTLRHMSSSQLGKSNITSAINISDKKFGITFADGTITIYDSSDNSKPIFNECLNKPVANLTLFSQRLIFTSEESGIVNQTTSIFVFDDINKSILKALTTATKVNCIVGFKDLGVFMSGGDSGIQIWKIDDKDNQLVNCNNLLYTNMTPNVMTIAYLPEQSILFGGLSDGNLVSWELTNSLKEVGVMKLHGSSINKIDFKSTLDGRKIMFTCSSDGTIKILLPSEGYKEFITKTFNSPVHNIYFSKDFYDEDIYIIQVGNTFEVLDKDFDMLLFTIPSKGPSSTTFCKRFVLEISNPLRNNEQGNFLLLTDHNQLEVNVWVKEKQNKMYPPKSNPNTNPQFNNYSTRGGGSDRGDRGNYRGGRGTYRGGRGGQGGRGDQGY